jgi:UDP-N-acetylglucosamine 2-epimerase (non-hydrolysing)
MKRNVLFVFGTRPEAIKMAPVIRELDSQRYGLKARVCVTAQHREMLDQVLSLFRISVQRDLNIMRKGQTLEQLTARALVHVGEAIAEEQPAMVVVQGDTTTTFAASLAAFYQSVPVAHIEAGLRTGDFQHPFPEEMNRVLTTRLALLHFAPTPTARDNLVREGIPSRAIHITGNTGVDALLDVVRRQKRQKTDYSRLFRGIDWRKRIILVTGHRRENFGVEFRNICRAIRKIAGSEHDVEVIYPVHLNPNVQKPARAMLANLAGVHLLPPLPYDPFVWLMRKSYLVLTDSGGIQEEAPSLGKPVLVMRRFTERPEGVKAGTVRLVGTSTQRIVDGVSELLGSARLYRSMSRAHNPYGDGKASRRIAAVLRRMLH